VPSIRHSLLVKTERRTVVHHRRGEDGRIETGSLHDGPLTLDPPGLLVDLDALYG